MILSIFFYRLFLLFSSFSFAVNKRSNELTYSNMQIIAREVELQTMRRSTPKNTAANPSIPNKAPQKPKPQNHLQRLNMKSAAKTKTKDLVRYFLSFSNRWELFCYEN